MTIEDLYDNLIQKIKTYHPDNDLSIVEKAFDLAREAHSNQFRKSGEPYIIHPLSVACILADLELDFESIVSGILHDVIEDTPYSYDDIVRMFGQEIADIVNGVTKLDKLDRSDLPDSTDDSESRKPEDEAQSTKTRDKNDKEELQAENYRKMFLAMAKDIRVILIKIADRLHNMRTLKYKANENQKRTAQETLDIYAPLAHRLGISRLRYELEDLSFRFLDPEAYYELSEKINKKQTERQAYIGRIVHEISVKLESVGVGATVEGRPKHFFSIYKKMKGQNKTLDQIFDLFAVRVLVDTVHDCYEVFGIIHEMYTPLPGRVKDYIAMPKSNMYQSLHTVIMGPEGEPVEIQIRTWEMHRTSEYGIAAHWKYKADLDGVIKPDIEEEKLAWLRQILDWQRDLSDNREFLLALKVDLDVYTDHVYCFTPKGQIVSLLRGSTPIDFAYAIHSVVGNKMICARVNGSIVRFEHQLTSGDRVEIVTSQNSRGPSKDWLSIVRTTQAKNKINQWFKKENKEENLARGKELLDREAKKKGYSLSELLNSERKTSVLNRFGFKDWDSLCAAIGHGGVKEGQVTNRLIEEYEKEQKKNQPPVPPPIPEKDEIYKEKQNAKKKSGIVVKGVGDISVRFSKCCSPVPGDEIIGFVTRGRGVSIHRTDCINIINLDEIERHRLIDSEWQLPEADTAGMRYRADIRITGDDRMGLLMEISKVLTDERVAIKSLNARTTNSEAIFDVSMEISDRDQLEKVKNKIMSLPGVQEIDRVTV